MIAVDYRLAQRKEQRESRFKAPAEDGQLHHVAEAERDEAGIVGVPVLKGEAAEAEEDDNDGNGNDGGTETPRLIDPTIIDKSHEAEERNEKKIRYGVFHRKGC